MNPLPTIPMLTRCRSCIVPSLLLPPHPSPRQTPPPNPLPIAMERGSSLATRYSLLATRRWDQAHPGDGAIGRGGGQPHETVRVAFGQRRVAWHVTVRLDRDRRLVRWGEQQDV